jgi:WD40 repeat protein
MNILSLRFKFGQTYSTILIGTVKGFMMFNIHNGGLERILWNEMKNDQTNGSGVGLYDNLDNSNIALLVGGGDSPVAAQNRFIVLDTQKKRNENDKSLRRTINIRDKIVNAFVVKEIDGEKESPQIIIVTRREIFLYTINGELIASKKTYDNMRGLCCCVCSSVPIVPLTIAYPGVNIGEVVIWRPAQDNSVVIKAHDNEITNISLSFDGKQLVTTSSSATNVHVYSTSINSDVCDPLLHKFRRNTNFTKKITDEALSKDLHKNSQILSVCISDNKEYIACCSSNGTIHIFDTKSEEDSKNKTSILSWLAPISNYFNSKWAMHTISIGVNDTNIVCGFDKNNNLHIATYNGDYFFLAEKENFILKSYSMNTI